MNLMQVNQQWSTRPDDERFTSLTDLHAHVQHAQQFSAARVVSSRALTAVPVANDPLGLQIAGPSGIPVALTNWSFNQLAQRAGAPSGYLQRLPTPLAADCINYGLHVQRQDAPLGVLLYKNSGPAEMRAITGPSYGRIWNSTVTNALVQRFGDGITGDFRVPGEFGKAVHVTKENTTLYASDRDMFVFLADEEHRIEIPNRRDGKPGSLARGFFVGNSEVGAQALFVATFLFDYVCSNRIVWGAKQYKEIRIRHTSGAPERWIDQVMPAIQDYATSSSVPVRKAIASAKSSKLDDVETFLSKRFSRAQVSAIQAAHLADEQRPIETLWDVAVGATAYARGIQHQDARVNIEREAGKILDLAA